MSKPLFPLGQLVMTAGVKEWSDTLEGEVRKHAFDVLFRHVLGDWGEVCPEDAWANDVAVSQGGRILSVYTVAGRTVWIITEASREATTILFPDDY